MTHSHDKTYISSLGFGDPDKKGSEHEEACFMLCQKDGIDNITKLLYMFGKYKELKCKKYELEKVLNQESGSFKRTIGFIDIQYQYTRTSKYRNNEGKIVKWEDRPLTVNIEVKIHKTNLTDVIRQIKFYREYFEKEDRIFILITKYKITEQEIAILWNENIIYSGLDFFYPEEKKIDCWTGKPLTENERT